MNDDELNEFFEPLRATGPSAEMRSANRDAALGASPVTPWWRRTVEVPLPVAGDGGGAGDCGQLENSGINAGCPVRTDSGRCADT